MSFGLFADPTSKAVGTALTGLQMRQQAIANNIANVDTPNYKAQKVSFEETLQAQLAGPMTQKPVIQTIGLATTDTRHIQLQPMVRQFEAKPVTELSNDGTMRNDGNNVDVEREMTRLAETQLTYSALGQTAGSKLGLLRTAINEGRR
jgi:flagellar basal-body rod protein FlgB